MSEIKGFDLSRLTQDENFGFHSFAIVEFEKCKDSKITEFVNNYKVKYNVFDGSMKVSGGENVLSYDVTRLDKVRDDAFGRCFAGRRHEPSPDGRPRKMGDAIEGSE